MLTHFILALCILFVSLSSLAADSVAKVIKVQGVATAISETGDKRALSRGSDVYNKETIITATGGALTLHFTDGTVIDLGENSKYSITNYSYNAADPKGDKFNSEIIEGGFRAITGSVASRNPSAFSTKARMTTLTVRGTYFYLICPPCAEEIIKEHKVCNAVLQFTLKGVTNMNYQGKDYLMGPGLTNSTFSLDAAGKVNLSNKIPQVLPINFTTSPKEFQKAVTSKKASSGGGAVSCSTLTAVGNALP
jgi:hypothetical protein